MDLNNSVDVSNLADIDAMLARLREAKKGIVAADKERQGALVLPIAEAIVAEKPATTSAASGWTGMAVYGVPVTVDGVLYHARVQLTHVKAHEDAKKAIKADGHLPADWPFEVTIAGKKTDEGTPSEEDEAALDEAEAEEATPEPTPEPVSLTKTRARK